MSLTTSRVCRGCSCKLVALALALVVVAVIAPADAAIARSSDFQLYQRDSRGGLGSNALSAEKSASAEVLKPRLPSPSLVIDSLDSAVPDVDQQLIPDPLPPVFDDELALSAPRRLDVVKEAGAELPWPIGSYNAHIRGVSIPIADALDLPHLRRQHVPVPESPDQRHRYMHSILRGYGDENFAGAFGA